MAEYPNHLIEHRFQGLLTSCGMNKMDLPIVSHIHANLWQGASVSEFGYSMPDYFKTVLNLYPWGEYEKPEGIDYREYKLYDSHSGVDAEEVDELAQWAFDRIDNGPLLIHCQAGVNRSSLIAALVLRKMGFSSNGAIDAIRVKRGPECLCNPVFEKFVRNLDVWQLA